MPTYPATNTTVTTMATSSPLKLRVYRLGRSGAGLGSSLTNSIFTAGSSSMMMTRPPAWGAREGR
jgi:hypothetical protein